VNFHRDELISTQNFLRDMQNMLYIARDNVKTAQDRACFYADQHRQPRVYYLGQKVFLHIPHDSTTLSTGKCAKLAPRFCGPFTVLKRIGSSAYCLDFPANIKIHPVFHVSRLKELLGSHDNPVSTQTLVTLEDLASKPHMPERILNSRTKRAYALWKFESLKLSGWMVLLMMLPGSEKILFKHTSQASHCKSAIS
jgi:hypothetical protein